MELKQNAPFRSPRYALANQLVETWSANGRLRKTKLVYDLTIKGRIRFLIDNSEGEEQPITLLPEYYEKFGNQIDSMISMLNNVYGENWDFHLIPVFDDNFKYYILNVKILFPEFTIINQDDKTHQIRNLITCFEIGINTDTTDFTIYPKWLEGTRATISQAENFSGYMHSHLHATSNINYRQCLNASDFCTGGNTTEINTIRDDLFLEGYVEEKFEMYLYMIQTFVEYESIEGIPYIRFSTVVNPIEELFIPLEYRQSYINEKYSEFKDYLKFSDLNYTYNNGKYQVLNDNALQSMYRRVILKYIPSGQIKDFLVKKTLDGKLIGLSHKSIHHLNTNGSNKEFKDDNGIVAYTMIQGRKIEFKIDGEPVKIDVDSYTLHPNLDNYARQQMEQQLYEKGVKRSIFKRQYQSSIV